MKSFYFAALLFLIGNASYSQTLPPPFTSCPTTGFQVVNNPSDFQTVNLATGVTTTVATFADEINAMGFNPVDGRIYGIKRAAPRSLAVIGSDNTCVLFTTTGDALQSSFIGDVNSSGILWCMGTSNVFTIDCNPSSPNFKKVTNLGAKPSISITDWSFPTSDNSKVYSVNNAGGLVYVKTSDLSVTQVMPDGTVPAESFGATYFDANGNFYAKGNTTGNIYKFINATGPSPSVILFSTSTASSLNDGARCASAAPPIIADYGDAPNSYLTTSASGGACHILPTPNPTDAKIYLGSAITIDADGAPASQANTDADDAVSTFPAISGGTVPKNIASYSVTVAVHNTSASTVNVVGWIDWNNNGTFESSERVATTAAPGFIGNTTLTWTNATLSGPGGTTGTYARFRVSSDPLPNPGGTVSNGEVEDYFIQFSSVLPVSLTSFNATALNKNVLLTWQTASELNNKGFYIERSENGSSFTTIGFLPSKSGNSGSTQTLSYNFLDNTASPNVNFYRLKQVDIDNKVTYSNIIKIDLSNALNNISVYPNPAHDKVTIAGLSGNITLQLYNSTGQLVKEQKNAVQQPALNISNLPNGVYQLIIISVNTGKRTISKIIKK